MADFSVPGDLLRSSILAGSVSLLAGSLAAPFVLKGLKAIKSSQTIQKEIEEHQAKQGTPTMGGFIILIGLAAGLIASWRPDFLAPALILLGFGLVGFLDDYVMPKAKAGSRGLDWKPKLALEILSGAGALWVTGISDPVAWGWALFLILFYSNAYNFSDGLDGLAGGLGMVLCLGLAGLMVIGGGAQGLLPLTAALGMAFIPFLFFNAAPARVFMGDVGALPLGAVLGWVVFRLGAPAEGAALSWTLVSALAVLSILMLIEIVPGPLQVLSVKLRKGKRLFPFKTPVHHGFQSAGWPETRVVALFHLFQGALVFAAWAMASIPLWSGR